MLIPAVPSGMGDIVAPTRGGGRGRDAGPWGSWWRSGETEVLLSPGTDVLRRERAGFVPLRDAERAKPSPSPPGGFGLRGGDPRVEDSDGAGRTRPSRSGTTGMHQLHPPQTGPPLCSELCKNHREGFSSLGSPRQRRPPPSPGHVAPKTVNFALFSSYK